MPEIIQDWLGSQLGILLDLSPKNFGRNTQDGRLLAKLLYSYGVIPASVLNKIKESNNYYVCYENLTILKPWLNYIGVTVEESALKEMAGGQGTTSVSIFYDVYLNLEGKDRLYYLSLQKERRVSEDRCRDRFKVDWVPEKEVMGGSDVNRYNYANLLYEKREIIEWHKAKCKEVVETIKKTKERFRKMMGKEKPELGPVTSKHTTSQPLSKRELEAEETKATIDEFVKKQPKKCHDLSYAGLMELKNLVDVQPCLNVPNPMEAQKIMCKIKHKKKGEVYAQNFTQRMGNMVLDEQWKEIMQRQDDEFDNKVSETLLKRCQYEKQMASKLYQMRNQKKVLTENRRMIESLKTERRDKECDDLINERAEMRGEYWEEEEFERERNDELHRRLYDEKVKERREGMRNECTKITEDIVDIAIRISEIRTITGCQIPKSFMRDLKQLFFKNLSIFDLLDHFEKLCETSGTNLEVIGKENEEKEEGEEGEGEKIVSEEELERIRLEEERQRVLDECDFNDYLNLLGPWMVQLLFPDSSETEVRHVVLGYIVHKLLEVKYPIPNLPKVCAAIKPMRPTAVIQGLWEGSACQMLVDLMELRNILVVRVDDVINFVLSAYKEELAVVRDIDITFQKMTANALKEKPTNVKEKEVSKKVQLLKKENPQKSLIATDEVNPLDKETQTPRMIPEDDPILSPNAELGKRAFEALGAGDPVPDPVIVSAIIVYVLSKQEDYEGWVLLNYPLFYSQARDLECALTGYQMLPTIDDMESLEDVEGFGFREPCVNPFAEDSCAEMRTSRLLPRSYIVEPPEPRSYFDFFIKLRRIGDFVKRPSQDSLLLSPMEKFYSDQEILFNFEYSTLNFQSVKNLGKTILAGITERVENNLGLQPKTSLEIFGGDVLALNEKWDPVKKKPDKKANEKEVGKVRQKVTKESRTAADVLESQFEDTEDTSGRKDVGKVSMEPPVPAKPGDPGWEWASGVQPEAIQLALASLWESMEAVYIEDLKNIFFCLRIHRANVLSYVTFLRSSTLGLMNEEDDKQKVLGDFQQMFNDIEGDLRPDVDIKCELHVRVSELEEALMGIADQRRKNFRSHVGRVTEDGWISDEIASVVNYYLMAVQLEADRCVDSCQVINDYYLTLQQKIPDPKPFVKVVVPKLQVRDRKYSILSSVSGKNSMSPRLSETRRSLKSSLEVGTRSNHERMSKTRSWMDKRKRSSENSFLAGATEVIVDILVNLTMPEDGMTPFHHFFIENVQGVASEVSSLVESCLSETKKGDRGVAKNPKKGSDVKAVPNVSQNLLAEWSTALDNELSRFQFRTKLILARGIFEMNEFLMTLLNVLSCVYEEINERYLKEVYSISECCKLFRCAIEKEEGIQPRLELIGIDFFANYSVMMYKDTEESPLTVEEVNNYCFTISQLSVLAHKLLRVAPDGEIIKRSFAFILEDLRVLRPEVENGSCVPEAWKLLKPDDITTILDEIYQDLEIVHWKDFIIYGMDIPMPTEKEILTARQEFRKHDPLLTELISRDKYEHVTFWFDSTLKYAKETEKQEKAKDLLFRMYQVNEVETNYSALLLAFCKDKDPVLGFLKALALVLGKKVVRRVSNLLMGERGEGIGDFDYEDYNDGYEESYVESSKENKVCSCKSVWTETSEKTDRRRDRCDCYYPKIERQSYDVEPEYYPEYHEGVSLLSLNTVMYDPNSDTTRVPVKILSSLLKASFPLLPQLTILLDSKETFQETLNSIYDGLDSTDGKVDVDDLLNHKFISRLLKSTNKFKLINYLKFKTIIPTLNETDWSPQQCSPKYPTCSPVSFSKIDCTQFLN